MGIFDWMQSTGAETLQRLGCDAALADELEERIARVPAELNSYGYDPWGYHPDFFKKFLLPSSVRLYAPLPGKTGCLPVVASSTPQQNNMRGPEGV